MSKTIHPLFRYTANGWHMVPKEFINPVLFVFEKPYWKTPKPDQINDYNRRRILVEANGGRMVLDEHHIAGKNDPLTIEEVQSAIDAVKTHHPNLRVVTHWNGVGCYTLSVGTENSRG